MERAILICRCSTNESKQDVSRQTIELTEKYESQYDIVKKFSYYRSGTKNDIVNSEIIEFATTNNIQHIITMEISRISRKISSFALFLEECNTHGINIIIDNFKLHTLLNGEPNIIVQATLNIASSFMSMELSLISDRLSSGRAKFVKDGGVLGRKIGSVKSNGDLLNEHKDIIKHLRQGHSIRNTATLTGRSSGTVQKVKKIFLQNN